MTDVERARSLLKKKPNERTVEEVRLLQNTIYACCNEFAKRHRCNCLAIAQSQQKDVKKENNDGEKEKTQKRT